MSRRVVITGMGWITPLGHDGVWAKLLEGTSGVGPTTRFHAETFPTQFSAEVDGFSLSNFLGARAAEHDGASRNTQFALAAAHQAWESAGLSSVDDLDSARVGVYLGGGEGPLDFDSFAQAAVKGWVKDSPDGPHLDVSRWAEVARRTLDATTEFEQEPNLAAGHLAVHFQAGGPCFNTLTACAASTQAIGEASAIIRRGHADVIISGGAHTMIHPLGVTGFNRLTALPDR